MPGFTDLHQDLNLPDRVQPDIPGRIRRILPRLSVQAGLAAVRRANDVIAPAAPANQTAGMSAGPRSARGYLSFWRIVDIPFETFVTALESGLLTAHGDGWHAGQAVVRGPVEHDRDSGTCRIQVRLARGPLRPRLRMRLDIDHWSSSPPRTTAELIPCGHVRPSAAYYRAGHLLLNRLTDSLAQHVPRSALGRVTTRPPNADQDGPGPDRRRATSAAPVSPVPGVPLPGRRPEQVNSQAAATPPPSQGGAAATHRRTGA